MHELAIVSGISAALRLGAEYTPFDDFATDFLRKYLWIAHAGKGRKGIQKGKSS